MKKILAKLFRAMANRVWAVLIGALFLGIPLMIVPPIGIAYYVVLAISWGFAESVANKLESEANKLGA